jgi:hypothetical protein
MKQILVLLAFAFVGWAFCAAIMGIGPTVTTMQTTLIVHAIAGPLAFGVLAYIYGRKFHYTGPLATALMFVGFVVLVDFFLVSMVILKDFSMFRSVLGTWLPFCLIFLVCYAAGRLAAPPVTRT